MQVIGSIWLFTVLRHTFSQVLCVLIGLCLFFKAARIRGVDCVVAPYEADAQLAFLNKAGIAQAIITEDSDLLAFGCKKVLRL